MRKMKEGVRIRDASVRYFTLRIIMVRMSLVTETFVQSKVLIFVTRLSGASHSLQTRVMMVLSQDQTSRTKKHFDQE